MIGYFIAGMGRFRMAEEKEGQGHVNFRFIDRIWGAMILLLSR